MTDELKEETFVQDDKPTDVNDLSNKVRKSFSRLAKVLSSVCFIYDAEF